LSQWRPTKNTLIHVATSTSKPLPHYDADSRSRLQQRFAGWSEAACLEPQGWDLAPAAELAPAGRDEVHLTLTALGYEPLEIQRALSAVAVQIDSDGAADADLWIRFALQWLSRDAA
jgi:Holliday junction DNA helicase RuvA